MTCAICKENLEKEVYQQPYLSIAGLGNINYVHRIVMCCGCGLVYASPPPSTELMARYYRELSNYENPQRAGKGSVEDANKWKRTCEIVASRFPAGYAGALLEIGCATGFGLHHFKEKGWKVLGNDPSPKAAGLAQELYGIEVVEGMFDSVLFSSRGPFDAVVLSHVVEHLVDPAALIGSLKKILKPEGVVYIEVPNLLRPYVPMGYFMFEHLSYFTPTTLTALMENCGFVEDSVSTFDNSPEIEPCYPVIASTYKLQRQQHFCAKRSDYDAASAAIKNHQISIDGEIARLQARVEQVCQEINGKRLALWGAGLHTSQLLSLIRFPVDSLSCIYDNDPKKHGRHVCGVEVCAPPTEGKEYLQKTDAILISSKASENEIYRHISSLERNGVRVFKLYS